MRVAIEDCGTAPRDTPAGRPKGLRGRPRRRGAAVVEFAVVAPIFFLLVFGMIEYGRMLMVQQVLTNGSREGARRAVLEQSTSSEVQTVVKNYLESNSVFGATVSVSPSNLSSAGMGDPVTVSVSVPFSDVSWTPSPWFLKETTLFAQSVMNAERPE